MSDEQVAETPDAEEPQFEVTPVDVKPGTVDDLDPTNPEGEVVVYEDGGSWHKEQKGSE